MIRSPVCKAAILLVALSALHNQPSVATEFAFDLEREVIKNRDAFNDYLASRRIEKGPYRRITGASAYYGDSVEIMVEDQFLDLPDEDQSRVAKELAAYWSVLTPEHSAAILLFQSSEETPFRTAIYTPTPADVWEDPEIAVFGGERGASHPSD